MSNRRKTVPLFIDRALSRSIGRQAIIMLILLAIVFLISFVCLKLAYPGDAVWNQFCEEHSYHIKYWLLPLYLLLDTNAFNNIYMNLEGSHAGLLLFATLTYICGVLIFGGALIGIITNMIGDRVESHRDGLLHYVNSGHYLILGYDEMVPSLITEIFAKSPKSDVVILSSMDAKVVREKVRRSVARDKMDQIFISYGHKMVQDYYKDVHLENAVEVFIVGNRTRPAHDAVNVECVDSIWSYLNDNGFKTYPRRITCVFEDLDTYASFKTTEIFSKLGKKGIDFVPYNFYEGWARQVLCNRTYKEKNRKEPLGYPSVYGGGIRPDDKKQAHLVFVGTSYFSVAFAMEAAHMLHFPNFEGDKSLKTRITFIELNAETELNEFATRNRHFFEVQPYWYRDMAVNGGKADCRDNMVSPRLDQKGFLDVEFEFVKGDIYSKEVQDLIAQWATDDGQYLSLFLAMADQRKNFMLGMNLPDEVYDRAVPVFIRQDRADDFVTNLRTADDKDIDYSFVKTDGEGSHLETVGRKGRYAHIYPFGMDDMAYCNDDKVLQQAKLINYLYFNIGKDGRFPDIASLDATPLESIKDKADEKWQTLSVAVKWSNLYAAYSIPCKLDSLRAIRGLDRDDRSHDLDDLTSDEAGYIAAVEHNRWNVEKLLMGYRKARPEEDKYNYPDYSKEFKVNKNQLFIHHDIRPFDALDSIKDLDFEFSRYIPWILKTAQSLSQGIPGPEDRPRA